MPFGSEGLEPLVGLAVSGGGFRATLFHVGALWRLNELAYLPKLDRISSVSGGSITTGILATRWSKLKWTNDIATNFPDEVVAPTRTFCTLEIDAPAIGLGALLPWKDISQLVEAQYQKHLFGTATLQDLPDRPRFTFNSTNFMTGVDFRFSKPYAGDYRIGLIQAPRFAIALAVTASSAFPPFLSPVIRSVDSSSFQRIEGADLFDSEGYHKRLVLTDGGVYDNMGLETLEKRCQTLIVSDAGAPFGPRPDPGTAWHAQALRAFDVATAQARGLRRRRLIADYQQHLRQGTFWGITTKIVDYQLADALSVTVSSTQYLASIRTRLNPFSDSEQERLINAGYALCDAAMRRYVLDGNAPKPAWPYPNRSLDRPIEAEAMAAAAGQPVEAP